MSFLINALMSDHKIILRIKPGFWAWFVFMLGGIGFFGWLIIRSFRMDSHDALVETVLWFMLAGVVMAVKDFKYIVLRDRTMRVFSLFSPWGRHIDLDDFSGIVKTQEYGSLGPYEVLYLVDARMRRGTRSTACSIVTWTKLNPASASQS